MQYKIEGTPLPVLICTLDAGESMITESGGMSWMDANIEMQTSSNGGVGKALGRMFSGEGLFQNIYTSKVPSGLIAFASSFPGTILPVEISGGKTIIAQKSAFLASTSGVQMSVFFQKKLGAGFFGGEGFIMQKIFGEGIVFLEIDGHCVEYTLAEGQRMLIETGQLAAMEETVKMDVEMVKGLKNMVFGGEGLFNTSVTGPGKIWLQTMPASKLAGAVRPYISVGK